MAQLTMYPGIVNSPITELSAAISDTATTIGVTDASFLPAAPNLAVIGQGDTAETILYSGKSGNNLTGVTRGFQGTAKSWGIGQKVARYFTEYDYRALTNNISEHDAAIPLQAMTRQAIINGNFDIWQRGTSFTNPASGAYTSDRYYIGSSIGGVTMPNLVHSRQSLVSGDITGSAYHYRVNTDGAGSGYNSWNQYFVGQRIEYGTRYLCGLNKKVTLSFYARSSIPGKKIGVKFAQNYGSGGSPSTQETINGQVFTLTSSWQRYTVTVTTNTLSGKTFGVNNDDFLLVAFGIMWVSDTAPQFGDTVAETFRAAGNIDIAQVQVCAGDQALPFQPRSYGDELVLCQRYYENLDFNAMVNIFRSGTKNISCRYPFKVQKRVVPSLSGASDLSTTFGTGSKQVTFNRVADDSVITATGNVSISGNVTPYMTLNVGSFSIVAVTSLSGSPGDPLYVNQTVKDTLIGFDAELS